MHFVITVTLSFSLQAIKVLSEFVEIHRGNKNCMKTNGSCKEFPALSSRRYSRASCKVQTICELQFHVNGVPRPCHKVTLYRVPRRERGRPRHERGLRRSANHEFDSWRNAMPLPSCQDVLAK